MNTIPGVTFRPIEQWPGQLTRDADRLPGYRFSAPWSSTIEMLERELRMLGARSVVLQMDLDESDLRLDGLPRKNARPGHPGIILAFEAPGLGPLQYAVDTYETWEANLRAVTLTLEALRAVERYGATKTGEQYRGWSQLPPPPPANGKMTVEDAARFLVEQSGINAIGLADMLDPRMTGTRQIAYRHAAKRLHPDTGGDTALFKRLQDAKRVLDEHARNGRRR